MTHGEFISIPSSQKYLLIRLSSIHHTILNQRKISHNLKHMQVKSIQQFCTENISTTKNTTFRRVLISNVLTKHCIGAIFSECHKCSGSTVYISFTAPLLIFDIKSFKTLTKDLIQEKLKKLVLQNHSSIFVLLSLIDFNLLTYFKAMHTYL